jgi:hypothetical protein
MRCKEFNWLTFMGQNNLLEGFRLAQDGVEWSAQFVAHRRQELVFGASRGSSPDGLAQIGGALDDTLFQLRAFLGQGDFGLAALGNLLLRGLVETAFRWQSPLRPPEFPSPDIVGIEGVALFALQSTPYHGVLADGHGQFGQGGMRPG